MSLLHRHQIIALTIVAWLTAAPIAAQSTIDLNRDGIGDILLQTWDHMNVGAWAMNSQGQPTDFLRVLIDVDLTGLTVQCGTRPYHSYAPWRVVGTTDLNGDGIDDIVLQGGPQNFVIGLPISLLPPTGVFVNTYAVVPIGSLYYSFGGSCYPSAWKAVATVDLDGNGVNDILFQRMGSASPWEPGDGVYAWLMYTDGTPKKWVAVAPYPIGTWNVVAAADVNADGISDIVLQDSGTTHVAAWLMNGHGTPTSFVWIASYDLGAWKVVGTGDLNQDGVTDILLQDSNTTCTSPPG